MLTTDHAGQIQVQISEFLVSYPLSRTDQSTLCNGPLPKQVETPRLPSRVQITVANKRFGVR
jgi:hypothetical protein